MDKDPYEKNKIKTMYPYSMNILITYTISKQFFLQSSIILTYITILYNI
jgi:hypothetical protein